jgi:hypothetical protein
VWEANKLPARRLFLFSPQQGPKRAEADMDAVKDVAQIIYYLTLSIAGPLALMEYFKAKKRDRLANEYKIYDELDNRFFEYQKLALEYYDLDILDVPNDDPSLSFDKKRKQEMVAYAILFSLFERAFLMFSQQAEAFQLRQWSGWKHFLDDFIRRESVRTAWQLSKGTYDTGFQQFMDAKIAAIQAAPPPPRSAPEAIATPPREPAPVIANPPLAPAPVTVV